MAKTRLTVSTRQALLDWMGEQCRAKLAPRLEKVTAKAIEAINKAVRAKYPENEMAVLRKHKCTMHDRCLKFVNDDGRVFGVDFGYDSPLNERLADLPQGSGCRRNDVFPVGANQEKAIDAFVAERDKISEELQAKKIEYRSFLEVCRYVEDLDEVVPLPEDMRIRYFSGGALVAVNPDVIASIKKDFANIVKQVQGA